MEGAENAAPTSDTYKKTAEAIEAALALSPGAVPSAHYGHRSATQTTQISSPCLPVNHVWGHCACVSAT